MGTIGNILREARESLGITLEEVERATRIRAVRLEALEKDDFESLPSKVQVRGFLRNYAEYLGLNPQDILDQYMQGDIGKRGRASRKISGDQGSTETYGLRRPRRFKVYGDQLITGSVALAVIALLVWGVNRIIVTLNQPTAEQVDPVAEVVVESTEAPTSTAQLIGEAIPPAEATRELEATITPTLPLGLVDFIELEILAEQSAFVQVIVDGLEEFQGRLPAGERLSFRGEERVEVITGNGRGLRVYFNDQDQGLMGQVNQVLTRIWTIRGMQTPTPTQTLTPTASPLVPDTLTPTITPVFSVGE